MNKYNLLKLSLSIIITTLMVEFYFPLTDVHNLFYDGYLRLG